MARHPKPFPGTAWDDRWPDVVAYYAAVPYLNGDPVDEFMMLARQLLKISTGERVPAALAEFDIALAALERGERAAAGFHATRCYQMLFYNG
jgi:hypothetical protein